MLEFQMTRGLSGRTSVSPLKKEILLTHGTRWRDRHGLQSLIFLGHVAESL